jgi:hypothetical protein
MKKKNRKGVPKKKTISQPGLGPGSKPGPKSERVVVDEILEDDVVRLLRAKRKADAPEADLGIDTWMDEKETFIKAWILEAFVGFPTQRKIKEGDVFYLVDGSKLHKHYKPIPRERARSIHHLKPWEETRSMARKEIKKEFFKLTAIKMASGNQKEKERLLKKVEKSIESRDL